MLYRDVLPVGDVARISCLAAETRIGDFVKAGGQQQ